MKVKKKINKLALFIFIAGVLLFVLLHYLIVFSVTEEIYFSNKIAFGVIEPIFFGAMFFPIPFLFLIFARKETVLIFLKKFVGWYVLASILILSITPTSTDALSLTPEKEGVSWALGIIYLIVSLIIIIQQFLKNRKQQEQIEE